MNALTPNIASFNPGTWGNSPSPFSILHKRVYNKKEKLQTTNYKLQTIHRGNMFTMVTTPNDWTEVVLTEPCKVMLDMEHMPAELATHKQSMHRVFAQITQRILLRFFPRRPRLIRQETDSFRFPLPIPLVLERRRCSIVHNLVSCESCEATVFHRGGIGSVDECFPLRELFSVQNELLELLLDIKELLSIENLRGANQNIVQIDALRLLHVLQNIHVVHSTIHATKRNQHSEQIQAALLSHHIPQSAEHMSREIERSDAGRARFSPENRE